MRIAVRNVLAVLLVAGSVVALPAYAGNRDRGHRDWNRHHDYSHFDRGGYRQHGGYRNHGYNDYRGGHHYRSHGRGHGREALYLAGGLVVGSALTHAYHTSYAPRTFRQPVYREVVYESSPIVRSTQVIRQTEGRRLFRDRNGDCFERTTSAYGEELLVELDRSACAW